MQYKCEATGSIFKYKDAALGEVVVDFQLMKITISIEEVTYPLAKKCAQNHSVLHDSIMNMTRLVASNGVVWNYQAGAYSRNIDAATSASIEDALFQVELRLYVEPLCSLYTGSVPHKPHALYCIYSAIEIE